MKGAVREIVPRVLQNKENCNLIGHGPHRRERNRGGKSKELSHWVEQPWGDVSRAFAWSRRLYSPNLRQFNSKMAKKHELGAVPLLLQRGYFVLQASQNDAYNMRLGCSFTYILNFVVFEQPQTVDKDPRQRAPKINNFMHQERHDACSEHIILHPRIPRCP